MTLLDTWHSLTCIPPWMEKRLCWRWSFLLTSSWIKWPIHQKAMWVCLKTREPKNTLENEKKTFPGNQWILGSPLRHSHVHASLINPPVQVSHLAAPEEEKHQCQHSIDALAKSMPTNANHAENITSYHIQPAFSWCLSKQSHRTSNCQPLLRSYITSAPCFPQGLGPKLFRLVKLFFHQPTQRTRHFQCRNFRRFLVLLLILSTSLNQVLSNVGKDFSQRKKLVPHELCESGFPKYTPEV